MSYTPNDTTYKTSIATLENGERANKTTFNRPIGELADNIAFVKKTIDSIQTSNDARYELKITKKSGFNLAVATDADILAGTVGGKLARADDPRFDEINSAPVDLRIANIIPEGIPNNSFLFVANGKISYAVPVQGWDSIIGKPSIYPTNTSNVAGLNVLLAGYATVNHTHTQYSPVGHTHTEYALTNHTHVNYSTVGHRHNPSEIDNLADFVKANSPSIKIYRQEFTYASSNQFTLTISGTIFKLSVNGVDLESSEWAQSGTTLIVNAESDDRIIVYTQDSSSITRTAFVAVDGTNYFTVAAGVDVWQVSINGLDVSDYSKSGTTITVPNLEAGDSVVLYGTK
jgi:hypothetical protein